MNETSRILIDALGSILGKELASPVGLHEPKFCGNEWKYVKDCIDTGWVSSVGSYVDLLEKNLAEKCGKKFAVVTVNGTEALHIALKLAGVGSGDQVLVPSMTFVATVNSISYCGAIPHFIDIERDTFGIDPHKLDEYLSKQDATQFKAIIPVHIFGHPCKIEEIQEVAEKYNIPVIFDAAEALGSDYKGHPCTSHGLFSTTSFNGNKIITTGGGGAILTDDAILAQRAKHLTTTAKRPHEWEFIHDEIGYNYRMPNINAALGCAQLEQLENFVTAKRNLANKYKEIFKYMDHLFWFVEEPENTRSNYWLNTILLQDEAERDTVLADLHTYKFLCRPIWKPMHQLDIYNKYPHMDLSTTEQIAPKMINIPSSVKLGN